MLATCGQVSFSADVWTVNGAVINLLGGSTCTDAIRRSLQFHHAPGRIFMQCGEWWHSRLFTVICVLFYIVHYGHHKILGQIKANIPVMRSAFLFGCRFSRLPSEVDFYVGPYSAVSITTMSHYQELRSSRCLVASWQLARQGCCPGVLVLVLHNGFCLHVNAQNSYSVTRIFCSPCNTRHRSFLFDRLSR